MKLLHSHRDFLQCTEPEMSVGMGQLIQAQAGISTTMVYDLTAMMQNKIIHKYQKYFLIITKHDINPW